MRKVISFVVAVVLAVSLAVALDAPAAEAAIKPFRSAGHPAGSAAQGRGPAGGEHPGCTDPQACGDHKADRRDHPGLRSAVGPVRGRTVAGGQADPQGQRLLGSFDGEPDRSGAEAGNVWRNTYDLRGRLVQSDDPDKGTAKLTYNDLDQVVTTTDARGKTVKST